jgi:hypothetical protein
MNAGYPPGITTMADRLSTDEQHATREPRVKTGAIVAISDDAPYVLLMPYRDDNDETVMAIHAGGGVDVADTEEIKLILLAVLTGPDIRLTAQDVTWVTDAFKDHGATDA